jgi:hypothetical protein
MSTRANPNAKPKTMTAKTVLMSIAKNISMRQL